MSQIKKIGSDDNQKIIKPRFDFEKILSKLTLALISIIIIFSLWRGFQKFTQPRLSPLPYRLEMAIPKEKIIVEVPQLSPQSIAKANALIAEGNLRLKKGLKKEAQKLFSMANAIAPGYLKAQSQIVKTSSQGQSIEDLKSKILSLTDSGNIAEAWRLFDNRAKKDRGFFIETSKSLAIKLIAKGHTASATSLLITFCQLNQEDLEAKQLLESCLKEFE